MFLNCPDEAEHSRALCTNDLCVIHILPELQGVQELTTLYIVVSSDGTYPGSM